MHVCHVCVCVCSYVSTILPVAVQDAQDRVIGPIRFVVCFQHFIRPGCWNHKVDLEVILQLQ